jgi:hypothetical protein
LPVLVPNLSYKILTIQEGATASETWNQIVGGGIDGVEADEKSRALLEYCALDTQAMWEIWRVLTKI